MDISKIPGWLLAVAVFLVAIGFLVSLYALEEPRKFAGLEFGPNAPQPIEAKTIEPTVPAIDYNDCDLKHTISDKSTMVQCPANYVVVGFAENRGHSETYNEPHDFKCCKLIAR